MILLTISTALNVVHHYYHKPLSVVLVANVSIAGKLLPHFYITNKI